MPVGLEVFYNLLESVRNEDLSSAIGELGERHANEIASPDMRQ